MSRLPRAQEYLKTGFTAEAASAARYRAAAQSAEREGRKNLAQAWLALAAEKDRLAIELLTAAGRVQGGETDLTAALAEERYENDALYPRMIREVEGEAGATGGAGASAGATGGAGASAGATGGAGASAGATGGAGEPLRRVLAAQQVHAARLETLRAALVAATGDIPAGT